ncbi:MAG: sugar phosphate nucleotidyltransferase [Patescibacteria group bacterium]
MKGIILAGGFGTRLQPMTRVTNKHLLPVYDKPMIYYPINTLVSSGIKNIMILTGNDHAGDFINLLGDGSEFGVNFTYRPQKGAGGIAQALGLCRDFVKEEPVAVILGDNIFDDSDVIKKNIQQFENSHDKACIFLKQVLDPERFGVATIKDSEIVEIEEKPKEPKSDLAVTGLYLYNSAVWKIIDGLTPSARNELEITSVNNWYIKNKLMNHIILDCFWSDAGTPESLYHSTKHMAEKISK